MKKTLALAAALWFTAFLPAYASEDISYMHRKDNAIADVNEIIGMRSARAKEFIKPGVEINEDVFKGVCGAVGKRVKEMADKEGVAIRHASLKNRNPKNGASPEEAEMIKRFGSGAGLMELSETFEKDGKRFFRYTKPIYVEDACLACHGAKDQRPRFIVDKYPEDKAFDYKSGDLRGIISATTPLE